MSRRRARRPWDRTKPGSGPRGLRERRFIRGEQVNAADIATSGWCGRRWNTPAGPGDYSLLRRGGCGSACSYSTALIGSGNVKSSPNGELAADMGEVASPIARWPSLTVRVLLTGSFLAIPRVSHESTTAPYGPL